MNKFKPMHFIIPLGIYPFDLMVSLDESDEVLLKRLTTKYNNTIDDCSELMDFGETSKARAVMLPSNQSVIRLKTLPKKYDMMATIAHEVFHITTFVLHRIGMRLELFVSDEAYAYLIGYITSEIYKKLKL